MVSLESLDSCFQYSAFRTQYKVENDIDESEIFSTRDNHTYHILLCKLQFLYNVPQDHID